MRAVGKTWQMIPNTLPYCKEEAKREIGPIMKKELHCLFPCPLSREKQQKIFQQHSREHSSQDHYRNTCKE